jgi:hypothetical protein
MQQYSRRSDKEKNNMATIGILIETEEGNVKDTNFGVLTAARGQGDNTIVALMMDGSAEGAKESLANTVPRKSFRYPWTVPTCLPVRTSRHAHWPPPLKNTA